jgi:hypothetical protein
MTTVRAAFHVHSNWSYDGNWPLEALARAFQQRGDNAVLTAEHDRGFDARRWAAYREACEDASTNALRIVPGIEYSNPSNSVHIAVWGASAFLGEGLEPEELLRRAQAAGGLAVLAHPWRKGAWQRLGPELRALALGVELWNRKYDGWAPNPAAHAVSDGLVPFVALDFHTARQFFPLAMAVSVEGPTTEAALLGALRAGRCRPEAFGVSALRFARGPTFALARAAEHARRPLARRVRRVLAARSDDGSHRFRRVRS